MHTTRLPTVRVVVARLGVSMGWVGGYPISHVWGGVDTYPSHPPPLGSSPLIHLPLHPHLWYIHLYHLVCPPLPSTIPSPSLSGIPAPSLSGIPAPPPPPLVYSPLPSGMPTSTLDYTFPLPLWYTCSLPLWYTCPSGIPTPLVYPLPLVYGPLDMPTPEK